MHLPSLFPQKLDRKQYCLRLLFAAVVIVAGHYFMEFIFAHLPPHPPHWARVILPYIFPSLWFPYTLLFVVAPRFRDTGVRWFAYLTLLVPLLNTLAILCAMFVPSGYFEKAKT